MRRLAVLLVVVAAGWTPPARATWFHHGPAAPPMLISASVAPASERALPPSVWLHLVAKAAGAGKVIMYLGGGAPTLEQCRTVAATYAITAAFMPEPHLPGLAQSNKRRYAMARIDVLNCTTGERSRTAVVRFESEPMTAEKPDFTWARAVADTFARHPLDLDPSARNNRKRRQRTLAR